jgi:hypothetical protein
MDRLARNNVHISGRGERSMVFAHGFGCDQNMWRGANMGDVVAALPVACPIRHPCHCWSPQSVLAGYLIGTGHFFTGAVTFITAEVLKLTLGERLFHLNRTKLLSIPAFAWGYRCWRHVMDVVESLEVWRFRDSWRT